MREFHQTMMVLHARAQHVIIHRELMTHHWAIYFLNATAAVNYYSLSLSQQHSRLCSPSTGCNFAPRAAAESLENSCQESESSWNSRRHQLFTLWAYSEKGEYNRDYTITCPPRPSTSPLLCIRQNNIYRAPPSGAERECCDARRVIFHGKKEWHSAPLIN